MSLGEDIKEVFTDLGTAITLIRDGGNVSGEYLLYEANTQATKPETLEFMVKGQAPYDTAIVPGEIINFDELSTNYLLLNKNPEMFENAVYRYQLTMYKVNTVGPLERPSGERPWNAQTYQTETEWETVKDPCYGVIVGQMLENRIIEANVGDLEHIEYMFFIPQSIGVRINDRIYAGVDSEGNDRYFKVDSIIPWNYNAVDFCTISEDTRED